MAFPAQYLAQSAWETLGSAQAGAGRTRKINLIFEACLKGLCHLRSYGVKSQMSKSGAAGTRGQYCVSLSRFGIMQSRVLCRQSSVTDRPGHGVVMPKSALILSIGGNVPS